MRSVPPIIEGANHRNLFRFWRPYGKVSTCLTAETADMRPQFVIELKLCAFIEQKYVFVCQPGRHGIGHFGCSILGHRVTSSFGRWILQGRRPRHWVPSAHPDRQHPMNPRIEGYLSEAVRPNPADYSTHT